MTITDKVKSIYGNHLGKSPGSLDPNASFSSIGVDDLDHIDLLMTVENEYGLNIDTKDKIYNIADVISYVEEHAKG